MAHVKICGIAELNSVRVACEAGAWYVGFIFHPPSPRFVTLENAKVLTAAVPPTVKRVGVFVNPDDQTLSNTLDEATLDMIQLHGDESPERVQEVMGKFGLPVIKAIRVAAAEDLAPVREYEDVADWLLFDTKVEHKPGGTGQTFDWEILEKRMFSVPWMLSGGLNEFNVPEALEILKPDVVDVSSGIEISPGRKDPDRLRAFVEAVRAG
ncbi:MAG: phosphoribosylanthranilate isomerase [Alphaproteobacteria bacterium]|nr:phosphoribosylanthranilate isomerase [Alphaproteobacteria bacterium]